MSKSLYLQTLETNAKMKESLAKSDRESIIKAKENGASWTEIGAAMEMTRQAAWEKYHKFVEN